MTPLVLLLLAGGLGFSLPFLFIALPEILASRKSRTEKEPQQVANPADEIRQALASAQNTLWGNTTPEIKAKMGRLESTLGILRPRLSKLGSSTYHTVFSTATKYLPDAANSYAHITRDARNTELVDGTKTATELFCEQLDIMNAELKKALDEATQVDATDLIVHGRFLEEKYGKADPVVEDVPEVTSEAGLESRIRGSFGVPDSVTPSIIRAGSGDRRVELSTYRPQDHRDCEEFEVRSASGEVVSRYCTKPHHETVAEYVLPKARYYAPGELPDEPAGPIPTGEYPVEVVDAEAWESKGGNPGFRLQLVITSGKFAGRRLWKTLVVPHSEQGIRMFERQVAAFGARCDLELVRWIGNAGALAMFLGRRANAVVRVDEYKGRLMNVVEFLTPARDESTVVG